MNMNETLITLPEAANMLTVSVDTVRKLCRSKRLRHVKIGPRQGAYRTTRSAVQDYLDSMQIDPGGSAGKSVSKRTANVKQVCSVSADVASIRNL